MAEQSAFCSFCGGGKPCLCGACEFNAGPESCGGPDRCVGPPTRTDTPKPRTPKWSEEDYNFLKTRLQEIRGAALIDSTMTKAETGTGNIAGFDTTYGTFHLNCSCAFHPIEDHVTFKVG